MDKKKKEVLVDIGVGISVILTTGFVLWTTVPKIQEMTMTASVADFNVVDALIRILPIAVISGLIIFSLPRCSLGDNDV